MIRIDARITATNSVLSKMYMNNPYYNKMVQLLEIGMTEEELMKAIHDICMVNDELTNTGLELSKISITMDYLKEENKQLKEALKKCNPMTSTVESQVVKGFTVKCCCYCESTQENIHEPNCEYVKLIGGI